jgi:hypothetical protein
MNARTLGRKRDAQHEYVLKEAAATKAAGSMR